MAITKIEINNVIIAGLGGMMILRSSLFSMKHKDSKVDVGLAAIVQIFLDLIERKMKNNAAAIKVNEINEIMKDVNFENAKHELSTLCICSIDNFSTENSEALIKKIGEISNLNISNKNKSIQLGINISQYCDNELLKNSIKVLDLKNNQFTGNSDVNNVEFYIKKLNNE